ncbi:hypothetical protein A3G69_05740 [Candidatus Peribacteria bacterium RIFCSPLOWO2_12_FULL_53_10]|nr:MAG: hypothetical protein A3G69_05740 [Candidatus Peribacteria bacterium RIFCSPLOWO2_12_FULL_53_10]
MTITPVNILLLVFGALAVLCKCVGMYYWIRHKTARSGTDIATLNEAYRLEVHGSRWTLAAALLLGTMIACAMVLPRFE